MKRDSRTDVLLWTLQNCSEYLFIEQLQQLLLEQILNRLWLYVWFCFESGVNNLNHFISVAAHKFSEIRNFTKFQEKHSWRSLVLSSKDSGFIKKDSYNVIKKRLWHRCFPVNFAKFLRTAFSQDTCGWLLLYFWRYCWKQNPTIWLVVENITKKETTWTSSTGCKISHLYFQCQWLRQRLLQGL